MAIPLGEHAGKKEISERYSWSLEHVSLFPGDFVEYYIQVRDNNIVTGPGVAKSRIFQVIVPTMAELYRKIRKEDAERRDLFEEAIQEGHTLRDRLSKLEREFIKTEKLEWSQKKEMDKALASQQSIEEKIEEIRKSLDETLQSLSDNQMTSQRIGEKIEQISELLKDIKDEALKEYIERLQEAMEKLSPEDIRRALRDLNISSEELLKRLERTAQLLEEIRKEQQMEELVRKSEDLTEAQEELNEGTEQADSGDKSEMDTLSDQQEELARETDQLKRDIEAFAGEVGEPTVAERLQEASEELSESETAGKMRRASQKLRQGEKRGAEEDQEEALENLVNLFTKMCAAQMEMQQSSSRYLAVNLQRIAKQALRLSFKQEDLAHRLQKATSPEQSAKARGLASEQLSHYKALEKLLDNLEQIASMTPAVSVSLMRKLGEALSHMQQAVLLLEQNKAFLSSLSANQAVGFLNEAAIGLLERAESCSSGGVSTGLQEMMKQLLAGEQQLMQQTKEMLAAQAMAERMRQERQAQMERLAGYQRSLKEIAEDIERSMDENKELLGRLEGTIKDMEEVIRDFERGDPDEQTLEKETRIISRLLDAQRSVHTRDYEKIRTSVTAKDVFSKGPGTGERARTSQTLREAIERAMKLKAPGEFEDLIRLYFRALAEEAEIESENYRK
jgi:hypothetical protein